MKKYNVHTHVKSLNIDKYDICIVPKNNSQSLKDNHVTYEKLIEVSIGVDLLAYLKNAIQEASASKAKNVIVFLPKVSDNYSLSCIISKVDNLILENLQDNDEFINLCFYVPNQLYYRLLFAEHFI